MTNFRGGVCLKRSNLVVDQWKILGLFRVKRHRRSEGGVLLVRNGSISSNYHFPISKGKSFSSLYTFYKVIICGCVTRERLSQAGSNLTKAKLFVVDTTNPSQRTQVFAPESISSGCVDSSLSSSCTTTESRRKYLCISMVCLM